MDVLGFAVFPQFIVSPERVNLNLQELDFMTQ